VEEFNWAPGEPNNLEYVGEDTIILMQKFAFKWNDNNPASRHEYEWSNKALCEGKCVY